MFFFILQKNNKQTAHVHREDVALILELDITLKSHRFSLYFFKDLFLMYIPDLSLQHTLTLNIKRYFQTITMRTSHDLSFNR